MTSNPRIAPEVEDELQRVALKRHTSIDSACWDILAAIPQDLALLILRELREGEGRITRLSSYLKRVIENRLANNRGNGRFRSPKELVAHEGLQNKKPSVLPVHKSCPPSTVPEETILNCHTKQSPDTNGTSPLLPPPLEDILNFICWTRDAVPPEEVRRLLAGENDERALRALASVDETKDEIRSLYGLVMYHLKVLRTSEDEATENTDTENEATGDRSSDKFGPQQSQGMEEVWEEFLSNVDHNSIPSTPQKASVGQELFSPGACLHDDGGSRSGQEQAMSHLEFRKGLLVTQLTGNNPEYLKLLSSGDVLEFGKVPHEQEESFLCKLAADRQIPVTMAKHHWLKDNKQPSILECTINAQGQCSYKGRSPVGAGNALQRALGDDRVLRVHFEDVSDNDLDIYIKVLEKGIKIALRHYVYFVHKQTGKKQGKFKPTDTTLASVKCFFICIKSSASADLSLPFMNMGTIEEFRKYFMNIYSTPTIAKFIAREHLLLSQTVKVNIDLSEVKVRTDDDAWHQDEEGRYSCATDGAGRISMDLAKLFPTNIFKGQSLQEVHSFEDELPLLSQIRMFQNGMAVKGTFLAVKNLKPKTIVCRQSMIKVEKREEARFPSPSFNSLELVSTSRKPRGAGVSKTLILLLSQGGVPNAFFLKLAENHFRQQCRDLETVRKDLMNMQDGLHSGDDVFRMLAAGMDPAKDFVLRQKLNQLAKWKYEDFYRGFKLPLPKSWYLMGTADPTDTLKHDEIALLLDEGPILCKKVLLYKPPGLHAGDIRLKEATWNIHLEAAVADVRKNVLIFSTHGPRSAPEEIANGDLDGDLYWVCINSELCGSFKPCEPWKVPKKPSTAGQIKPESQMEPGQLSPSQLEKCLHREFLRVRFNPSASIGLSAWNHAAHLDRYLSLGDEQQEEKASLQRNLSEIVDIHHAAVDSEKTGELVSFPPHLRAKLVPHYLKSESQAKVYHSTSVIGQMYDFVDSPDSSISSTGNVHIDHDFEYGEYKNHMGLWRSHFDNYRKKMTTILGSNTESKSQDCDDLRLFYRRELYGAETFKERTKPLTRVLEEAAAIYKVVYCHALLEETRNSSSKDVRQETRSLRGRFAWDVAVHALCTIYAEKQQGEPILLAGISTKSKISIDF